MEVHCRSKRYKNAQCSHFTIFLHLPLSLCQSIFNLLGAIHESHDQMLGHTETPLFFVNQKEILTALHPAPILMVIYFVFVILTHDV